MNFDLSDEQQLLDDSAKRFVRDNLGLRPLEQRLDPAVIWRQMAEMGWLALPLPERAGGLDGSFEDIVVLTTALGRGVVSTPYVSNAVLCGFLLSQSHGNAAADEVLAKLALGEARVALTDNAGQSGGVAALPSGDGYILSGGKVLSFDAPHAAVLLVSAQVPGETSPALFMVESDADGVAIDPYPLIDGCWAGDVRLQEVQVGSHSKLLDGDAAGFVLKEAIDRAALANLAQIVGAAEAAIAICADYLKIREQFGQPLGKFQALQHIASEMYVEAQEARSILYYGLSKIDAPARSRAEAVAEAGLVICEAGKSIGESGIQLHGGYGVTDEFAISHLYRRIMTLSRMFPSA